MKVSLPHPSALVAAIALLSACSAAAPDPAEVRALLPRAELPEDWATLEPLSFERVVLEQLPADSPLALDDADLDVLVEALGSGGESGVRAAVILSRSLDPRAAEVLLARLEERVLGPERHSDAGDAVAAAGLAGFPADAGRTARLVALAVGEEPHPDLEVRVECARSAVLSGDDRPLPFLLEVIRIGTRAGRESGTFWPAPLRSAWARERAAEVLAERAGTANRYSADASIGDREREAARLEELLGLSPTAP